MLAADDESDVEAARSPRAAKASIGERATLRARQLIVKVSGDDFPALTENEYHCLGIARALAHRVPQCWLSEDRKRLAIERFDVDRASGRCLGFEDMVSLQGAVNEQKCEGSYERVAKAILLKASPALVKTSLAEFFAVLTLGIVLRAGNAHLKNFGLLYSNPGSDDCRLSPVYDVDRGKRKRGPEPPHRSNRPDSGGE